MNGRELLVTAGVHPRTLNRVRYLRKLRLLRDYHARPIDHLGYLLVDPEIDNFTYELENESELVAWIAETFAADPLRVASLIVEARSNQGIYARLKRATQRWSVKTEPPLGRRLGWYAIARLLKPARIIETGIHDGLGSLALVAALDRNAQEGVEGELVSFDVDATAGWMVGEHSRWSRRIEDTRTGLENAFLEGPVQIFVHDSLHTIDHETFELKMAVKHMSGGVVLSDNAHQTDVLQRVADEAGRRYAFFKEQPRAHFYTGAGIGVAVRPTARTAR